MYSVFREDMLKMVLGSKKMICPMFNYDGKSHFFEYDFL